MKCKICEKSLKGEQQKYCSKFCAGKGAVARGNLIPPGWNKGLKGFRAGEKRPGIIPKGAKSTCWKGEDVGYRGLHIWVQLVLGKPEVCVYCGKNGTGHNMHWANISGEYKRDVTDWIRLCPKCHQAFDRAKRGVKIKK